MLIVHLFVSYAHVNLCHFASSSWCQGLAATSACGSSWTFLFTFFLMTQLLLHTQVKTDQKAVIGKVTLPDTSCAYFSLVFSLLLLKDIPVSWKTFRNY